MDLKQTTTTSSASRPIFITIMGWSSLIVASLMILWDLYNLILSPTIDQFGLSSGTIARFVPQASRFVDQVQSSARIWTTVDLLYFLLVFVSAVQLLKLRSRGRRLMEIAAWSGILLVTLSSVHSYLQLKEMEAMVGSILGRIGMQTAVLVPAGMFSIILGFLLWLIPCGAVIFFLRLPSIREAFSNH